MALFEDLKKFSKKDLRNVEVKVRFPDGKTILEKKNESGSYSFDQELQESGLGFVNDDKPDLQIAKILPNLYLGSQDLANEPDIIEKHRIKHVLNCSGAATVEPLQGVTHRDILILDLAETNLEDCFEECFRAIDEGRNDGGILVHCNAGVSRSVSIVVAYVMNRCKKPLEEAFQIIKAARPCARPNDGFMKQLQDYDKKISTIE